MRLQAVSVGPESPRIPRATVVVLLVVAMTLSGARAADSADTEKIAFFSVPPGGTCDIYLMDADGTDVTRLTDHGAHDNCPALSPDGGKIAFQSNRTGAYEVYVMDLDGGGTTRITTGGGSGPDWSPDGTKFAFSRFVGGYHRVCVMNVDGSGFQQLSTVAADEYFADWSPDGTKIAFMSNRNGQFDIYAMDSDGSSQDRLTDSPFDKHGPRWSPSGTQIIYYQLFDPIGWRSAIHLMNADGTGDIAVTDTTSDNSNPSWSPDGIRIAFQSDRSGHYELYTARPDGTDIQRLTWNGHLHDNCWPSWGAIPVVAVEDANPSSGQASPRMKPGSPARGVMIVEFSVAVRAHATLRIFDCMGRRVRTLVNEELAPGVHTVRWDGTCEDGRRARSGVYFLRLTSGGRGHTARVAYLR